MMLVLWIVLSLVGFAAFCVALIVGIAATDKYILTPVLEWLGLL